MRKLVLVAVAAALIAVALAPLVPQAESQFSIYWYYSLKAGYGAPAAYVDDMKVAPLMGYGGIGGGKWITLSPGIHEFRLVYWVREDYVSSEKGLEYPVLVTILADDEVSGPPGFYDLTGKQYWVLSLKHPWIWEKEYANVTSGGTLWRKYELVAYFEVTEDGVIKFLDGSDGYGTKVWVLNGSTAPTTTTTTTTSSGTSTTTTTTTTTTGTITVPAITSTTTSETPRPEPSGFFVKPEDKAVAVTAGAGALGLILLLLVVKRP